MKSLFKDLQEKVKDIFFNNNINIDHTDDDSMADFIDDLKYYNFDSRDIHRIITYNYMLQLISFNLDIEDIVIKEFDNKIVDN